MGAGHTHALYVHEHSPLHRLAPEVKVLAACGFVLAVAITPREAIGAFVIYATVVATLVRIARLPARFVLSRIAGVLPFVVFAFFIPFIASGERVDVLGVSVSTEGLWSAWGIVAKATLGVAITVVLAGSTEVADMLRGMSRLRVPETLTAIAGFMVRYLEVIGGELSRMRTAMTARGYNPRWVTQTRPIAMSAGALFVRSYERGERVHAAMVARGYTGSMPELTNSRASAREWWLGVSFLLCVFAVAVIAMVAA